MAQPTRSQHQSLTRRLFFPTVSGDIPPLLASNVPQELQAELYDFLALALRAYVNPWWSKITRYDKHFLPHTARILTVVVRALETRILSLDIPALVFHDLPAILNQHYRDYRNATSKLSSSYATGGAASLPQLFHHLQPHIALSPDGHIDPEYYHQIVDHILKACLPPEDYAPEAERVIIRQVIVKVLLDDVIPRVTQPWFIQKAILDLLDPEQDRRLFKTPDPPAQPPTTSFSFHNLIIFVLSALQSFSTTCLALIHAYKQAISTIKFVNQSPSPTPRSTTPLPVHPQYNPQPHHARIPSTAPSISSTPSVSSSISYPSRSVFPHSRETPTVLTQPDPLLTSIPSSDKIPSQPHYDNHAAPPLALFSEVFLTSERLAATILMTLFEMISASMTRFLDKLLPHMLNSALSPGFILNVVRLSKRTMFPNGYPGPPPIDPTPEEQAEIRQRLVEWRGSGGWSHLAPLLLGPDPKQTLNEAIDPLTCQPCNVHLLVILIDRLVVGLFPELIGDNNSGTVHTLLPCTSTTTEFNTQVVPGSGEFPANNLTTTTSGMQGVEGSQISTLGYFPATGGTTPPAAASAVVAVGCP